MRACALDERGRPSSAPAGRRSTSRPALAGRARPLDDKTRALNTVLPRLARAPLAAPGWPCGRCRRALWPTPQARQRVQLPGSSLAARARPRPRRRGVRALHYFSTLQGTWQGTDAIPRSCAGQCISALWPRLPPPISSFDQKRVEPTVTVL